MDRDTLKDKTVLVFDYCYFVFIAQKLSQSFGRVLYYCPYETSFLKHNPYIVGMGIPEIIRIDNIWDYYNEVDLWFFTDLHQAPFQEWLRAQGKIVFGAGRAEDLEKNRVQTKDLQEQLGLPLNKYYSVRGITELKDFLKDKENLWIKSDLFRGDNETWHFDNMKLSEETLIALQSDLGANRENEMFTIEEPIENSIEYGYDGFCIDGKYPNKTIFGIEIKDASYACTFVDYEKLPKPVKEFNSAISSTLQQYTYRGWYSNEMRTIDKDKAVMTDMTCRIAEPPTALAMEMFKDFGLYAWQVAYGIVPYIESNYKYGCMIMIKSDWAMLKPQPIYFPEEYKDFIKIKNLYIEDGVYKYIPQCIEKEGVGIGSILGVGQTLKEAINMAKKIAGTIEGYHVKINCDALDQASEEVNKLNKVGIKLF